MAETKKCSSLIPKWVLRFWRPTELLEHLSAMSLVKCLLAAFGLVASSLSLLSCYFDFQGMASFPVTQSVSGDLAHYFATSSRSDALLAVISTVVLTVSTIVLISEFLKNRRIVNGFKKASP